MAPRRKRKAKAAAEAGGFLVRFVPGGYYHLTDGKLLTGIHKREAGATIVEKLLPLAIKAAAAPEEWVTL
ncbi:hypothetical protein HFO56_00460 [Rhizobium laguerreae]|uniref:hypothetical protein n=1 Tax=Rhizobium laguerreae TaxID=1076926 RepID=UPI001C91BDC0|nr:hypothetical protein [Rhizobium laguerreae]MBY3150900.1 hypothetical protein [Rhizobium laguerreae]